MAGGVGNIQHGVKREPLRTHRTCIYTPAICTATTLLEVPKQKTCIYELYAVIENWLLALYEHFIHVCCLGTSNKWQYCTMHPTKCAIYKEVKQENTNGVWEQQNTAVFSLKITDCIACLTLFVMHCHVIRQLSLLTELIFDLPLSFTCIHVYIAQANTYAALQMN